MLGNDNLIVCYKETRAHLLKVLTKTEKARGNIYCKDVGTNENPYVTNIQLLSFRDKHFMIMPCFASTLKTVPKLNVEDSLKLWTEIKYHDVQTAC